jgi:hypothetical protein
MNRSGITVRRASPSDYIRHATEYGGLRDCWEPAWEELEPRALGEMAVALRGLASRRRRVGRKGRTVSSERFSLTRDETTALVERLLDAGLAEVDICRAVGVSPVKVREIGQTLTFRAENGQAPRGKTLTNCATR